MVTCDEIIEVKAKTITKTFIEKNVLRKTNSFDILLAFFIIRRLIAVSIYCQLMRYKTKQKHLLPFHVTNNELKEIMY